MDISPENSARLVSQLIKSAFNINYFSLRPIPSNPLCQPKIWEELTDCIKGFFSICILIFICSV